MAFNHATKPGLFRNHRNEAGQLSLMSFDFLGNSQWRHGIYPYPFEELLPVKACAKRAHAAALKKHTAQLPIAGKSRWSLQMHFRLRKEATWDDWARRWS